MLALLLLATSSTVLATEAPVEPTAEAEAPISFETIEVPGLEMVLHMPEDPAEEWINPWGWTVGDAASQIKLGLSKSEAFTIIRIEATTYQPEVAKAGPSLTEYLQTESEEDAFETYTLGEPLFTEHPVLGDVISLDFDIRDDFLEQDRFGRVVLFAIEGAGVLVTSVSSESAERGAEVLAEVLDMILVLKPPLATEDLPFGQLELPTGYSLELPLGWRALTEGESLARSTLRVAGDGPFSGQVAHLYVVAPSKLDEDIFQCTTSADPPLYVLDPHKSPSARENFLTYAKATFEGGRYRIRTGAQERFVEVSVDLPVVSTETPSLEFLELADRQAYFLLTSGTVYEEPRKVALFYTAWGDVALRCMTVVEPGEVQEATLETFKMTVTGIGITEGESHPLPLSMKARYVRWWPFAHPLLQLYWLPFPLLLLAGWLVMRDD
jgi:hypothetical protein